MFPGFEAYGTDSSNIASSGSNGGYFGGGGGGSSNSGPTRGPGGVGGGALGQSGTSTGTPGIANTGGGGGAGPNAIGGTGGTGIVIVRRPDAYEDMILKSEAYTAQTQPTTVRIIMDEYTAVGSATVNTDIKAYASRDNGTTYDQITSLANQGTITTNHRLLSGSLDVSGQPAGTSMKYKIETLNQSVSKQTRVYGVSMAWA